MSEIWFILYGGTSEDGRGPAEYVGRTKDRLEAEEYCRELDEDPDSVGRVDIVTEDEIFTAGPFLPWNDWDKLAS